jgi:hypothetical protein
MAHQLDFIIKENILKAIQQIDKGVVPKDNEWSEYWINHRGKLYQFKYVVEVASSFTKTPIKSINFTSNDSSRNFISALGFPIIFKSHKSQNKQSNYWVGASYYGLPGDQTDMFADFIKNKYWRTDHDLEDGEGLKIYNDLTRVQINDRLCIRYFDKKGSKVHIAAIGTVSDISKIEDGRLGVIWDYNPPQFKGHKPSGTGSGNWWKTFLQLKKHSDIALIFGETLIEKRIARIAWNDFGWVMPSGPFGKSEHKDSHEAKQGYGHEEWLFDTSKLIDGFHYGFLEPIRKEQDAYEGKIYNVWLYSINRETKKRFWIGNISNLIVLDREEADIVKVTYIDKGWFEEMEGQIKASGASKRGFSNWKGVDLFNVKFKPSDIFVNDPYFELSDTHPINDQSRYAFAYFKPEYEISNEEPEDDFGYSAPTGNEDDDENDPKIKTHVRQPKAVEIVYLHRAISNSLAKTLRKTNGKENVKREHYAGYGANKIDIVVKQKSGLTFYEIKTYNSIKTSIREAFGQLMEYCFYPNKQKAKELIIVTQLPADKQTILYIQHLRTTFKLPIYYQWYDLETKTLSEKY